MGGAASQVTGPDLRKGVELESLEDGVPLLGHVEGEPALVVRLGEDVHAVGAACTHYGGPLAEGRVRGDAVVCPWHHACFSLRTGEALTAPALNPLPTWEVEVREGRVVVGARTAEDPLSARGRRASGPEPVVIVGAGAAGSAAAETLRREGFSGRVVLIDPDPDAPYDRPNLSKDYLDGSAPEEWIPLRPPSFYREHGIERIVARAEWLDRERRRVGTDEGDEIEYGALLLAPGSTPVRLRVPGSDLPHVHVLRSLADARRIIASADSARRAVVIGASFIGMEAAASLRKRGLEVTVVAPEAVPFERALGPELGRTIADAHERNGVRLRMGSGVAHIESDRVVLEDGTELHAPLVVVGIGVRPETRIAEEAGLAVDDGVLADEHLATSDPRIWVAGDIARCLDPHAGRRRRIEHWVVAQRQGQAAARNILGQAEPYAAPPFFWTVHFDLPVAYVGHAPSWEAIEVEGDPSAGDAAFRYMGGGELLALATIGRDLESLHAEELLAGRRSSTAGGRA